MAWRDKPHVEELKTIIYQPDTVLTANVNQTSFAYPVGVLTIDGVSGDTDDVLADMTLWVKSSGGVHKGFVRVRGSGAAATSIQIDGTSEGVIQFENNDQLIVLNDFRLWTIIPNIAEDGTIYVEFNRAYSGQNVNQPPVLLGGGPRIAKDAGSGYADIVFDLTDSYHVAPDATTISLYTTLADLPTGVVVQSGSIASGVFTLRCDVGQYWVHFRIQDDLSTSTDQHIFIFVEGTGNEASAALVNNITLDVESGASAKITLLDDFDKDTYLTGTMVVVYADETYDGVAENQDTNIRFWGWLDSSDIAVKPFVSDVRVTALGPKGIMEKHVQFSYVSERKTLPTNWLEMKGLTPFRHTVALLRWFSNTLELLDLEEPDWATTYVSPDRIDANEGTITSQADFVAGVTASKFTCAATGKLYLRRDPNLSSDTYRDSTLTNVATLTNVDWTERPASFNYVEQFQYHWYKGMAILSDDTDIDPVASIAPGKFPAQGAGKVDNTRQIVSSQTEINQRTGHGWAKMEAAIHKFNIEVHLGGLLVDPAKQEWVTLTLASTSNRRQIGFSAGRFVIEQVIIDYDNETFTTTEQWSMRPESYGIPGETVVIPEVDLLTSTWQPPASYVWRPPSYMKPDPIVEDPTDLVLYPDCRAIFMSNVFGVYRSDEPDSKTGGPNWTQIVNWQDLPYPTGHLIWSNYWAHIADFALDPWNPEYRGWVCTVEKQAAGTVGGYPRYTFCLFEVLDIMTDNPTITRIHELQSTPVEAYDASIQGSINHEGMIQWTLSLGGGSSHGLQVATSNDYGTTWSFASGIASNPNQRPAAAGGLEHFSDSLGTVKSVFTAGPNGLSGPIMQPFRDSWNGGFNTANPIYTLLGYNPLYNKGTAVYVPYIIDGVNNTDADTVYMGYGLGSQSGPANLYSVFRVENLTDGVGVAYDITPVIGPTRYYLNHWGGNLYDDHSLKKCIWCDTYEGNTIIVSDGHEFLRSYDAGASWEVITTPYAALGGANYFNGIGAWPYDPNILFATGTGGVYWTDDGGTTWYNLAGSLGSVEKPHTLIPLWT